MRFWVGITDESWLTVTPELRLAVSPQIREQFENGHDYSAMQGSVLPARRSEPAAISRLPRVARRDGVQAITRR